MDGPGMYIYDLVKGLTGKVGRTKKPWFIPMPLILTLPATSGDCFTWKTNAGRVGVGGSKMSKLSVSMV